QLQLRLRRGIAGSLRTAIARRDGRRRHAVHAPRRSRGGLGVGHADLAALGAQARPRYSRIPVWDLGPRRSRPCDRSGRPALEDPMTSANLAALPLRDVEKELSRQLEAAKHDGEAPVQRAHMSNLVIYCDRADTTASLANIVPAVVEAH